MSPNQTDKAAATTMEEENGEIPADLSPKSLRRFQAMCDRQRKHEIHRDLQKCDGSGIDDDDDDEEDAAAEWSPSPNSTSSSPIQVNKPEIVIKIPALNDDDTVDADFLGDLVDFYKRQRHLPASTLHKILREAKAFFKKQPSLVKVDLGFDDVINVCGDIHGQYFDLCKIFDMCGEASESNKYLFNGDFVDRGPWSLEVLVVLLVNKLLHPRDFFLVRGNHESEDVNRLYGFQNEVLDKYDRKTFALIQEVFNWMPVTHLVNDKVLIMHGGLPAQEAVTLEDIGRIERGGPPNKSSLALDLLWSDPREEDGIDPNPRGFGCLFGPDVTRDFLEANGLLYIIRSHECVPSGYDLCHEDKVVTVFSAPNYCDRHGNKGAVCILHGDDVSMPEFKRFDAAPHPKVDPVMYASLFLKMGLL